MFQGFAVTGGAFYSPSSPGSAAFPSAYQDDYFFADFVGDWINVIDVPTKSVSRFATNASGPVDLHVGNDGSLFYLSRGDGSVYRVVHT
jgi:glucose/arabinose dehydrogenase